MLGKRSSQENLFTADTEYLDKIGRDSFYGFLALHRHLIFRDEDFSDLYCMNRGRESTPPSIVAIALLLQSYNRISDAEVVERATFDARWCVALGTEIGEQPFAKSTFCVFRAKLILNEQARALFERSLSYARDIGFLKHRKMRVALDTTHILGCGAVKDTYNLLADGVRKLYRTLEKLSARGLRHWLQNRKGRYFGSSFKGSFDIDWNDAEARQQLLDTLVDDIKTLLALAKDKKHELTKGSRRYQQLLEDMQMLNELVAQDLQRNESGALEVKQGVSKDRLLSIHDPEIRHGRKSHHQRFDGHKATIASDIDTQLITAVDVVSGNAFDSDNALALVQQSENNTSSKVDTAIGDCAYGTAKRRKEFEEANVKLVAKSAKLPHRGIYTKEQFSIDLEQNSVTCPAGHTTQKYNRTTYRYHDGAKVPTKLFIFDREICGRCKHYEHCVGKSRFGARTIKLHPEEAFLQKARAFQKTEIFKELYRKRSIVEHRLARLVRLGIRKSRYFGRQKTSFQLAMAAAVANFTLIAAWQAGYPLSLFCIGVIATSISLLLTRSTSLIQLLNHKNLA